MTDIRHFLSALLASCAAYSGMSAMALAEYPDRPPHMFVGAAPGGSLDTVTRLIGSALSDRWGQPVVVENRPGASNTIAADVVAHAPPDGYSFLIINGNHTNTPSQLKLNYDPMKSFAPVTLIATNPNVLVVSPSLPVHSIKELVAYAKANPGKLNFGSAGLASGIYLEMKILMNMTGIDMVNVNYTGGGPASVGLLGGETQLGMNSIPTALPLIQSGKLRALGVTTNVRSPIMPDVPTIAEAGLSGYDEADWEGVLLPAGTPDAIVNKLRDDILAATKSPTLSKKFTELGFITVADKPAEFSEFLKKDIVKWAEFAKANGGN